MGETGRRRGGQRGRGGGGSEAGSDGDGEEAAHPVVHEPTGSREETRAAGTGARLEAAAEVGLEEGAVEEGTGGEVKGATGLGMAPNSSSGEG